MDVAVIGGTGAEGFGLTLRLAKAGHHVVIGSRSAEKGAAKAAEALEIVGGDARIDGTTNEEAAASADVIAVTVPFAGQAEIYRAIKPAVPAGAIVLDATSPLATAVGGRAVAGRPPVARLRRRAGRRDPEPGRSDGRRVPHDRGRRAAAIWTRPSRATCSSAATTPRRRPWWARSCEDIPDLRWVDAGALSMARIVETMTALLVSVNRTYKVQGRGVPHRRARRRGAIRAR